MTGLPFALQLYTVRDHLEKDLPGTLAQVKAIGYDYVEIGDTFGRSHETFQQHLDQAGLEAISTHVGYDDVVHNVPKVVDTARAFGVRYVVVGGIDSRLTPDRAGWVSCGQALDAGGAALRASGIQLCYHNHAHEFQPIGTEYPFDILLGAAAPEHLAAQIDTFWVRYADLDPVALIRKYRGRCPLVHVKDMADAPSRAFAEVGKGILDWTALFRAGAEAGTAWYIVEQDTCPHDSLASAAVSAEFMARDFVI